ncbi:unnamed protein product [Dibothriocephalus latus]|uniref:Complement component 1 Q subcomponent-binding protein, mitochondrial n=1 Tax=Dibothriocephalus latus TaxID=60516 RepID=A0A3P7LQY3_DIBLA|nr:unnamed protein product [Dibothriocephalus latus]
MENRHVSRNPSFIESFRVVFEDTKCPQEVGAAVIHFPSTSCSNDQSKCATILFSRILEVEMDLAGSIAPEDMDETEGPAKEPEGPLDARPEFKIRLKKPSGSSVLFHCSFPSKFTEDVSPGAATFSVDMVEMERLPGYFVYTDLFDDNLYEHTVRLLTDRGIDSDFQRQLQDFATSEEHKLYTRFLKEFKSYCKE